MKVETNFFKNRDRRRPAFFNFNIVRIQCQLNNELSFNLLRQQILLGKKNYLDDLNKQ